MSVVGEGRSPGKREVVLLGKKMGLLPNKINEIIEQTMTVVDKWQDFAMAVDVLKQTKKYIQTRIGKNLSRF